MKKRFISRFALAFAIASALQVCAAGTVDTDVCDHVYQVTVGDPIYTCNGYDGHSYEIYEYMHCLTCGDEYSTLIDSGSEGHNSDGVYVDWYYNEECYIWYCTKCGWEVSRGPKNP